MALIDGFNADLDECGLTDLGMSGYPFTWGRGRGTLSWVEERLDRAVGSIQWCALYNQARVSSIGVVSSDHSALYLEWGEVKRRFAKRSFRFENSRLLDEK